VSDRLGHDRAEAGARVVDVAESRERPYRGETVFSQKCASCHGAGGAGGGIGPKLIGDPLSLAAAKAQIDNGGSVMPASLVRGGQERDVLAYLATVLAPP